MATTPEGRVKKRIKAILDKYKPDLWFDMPVPSGFGASQLDFTGWIHGQAFVIEAKAPGKKPTTRQLSILRDQRDAGAVGFVIDGKEEDYEELDTFLHNIIKRDDYESNDTYIPFA